MSVDNPEYIFFFQTYYGFLQGAWPLRKAALPRVVPSHGADPTAPRRGPVSARGHRRQYLRGAGWPPRAVYPRECKIVKNLQKSSGTFVKN